MLEVKDATLHYGAAQALRGVSLTARARQDHLRARPQRRRQDQSDARDRRPPQADIAEAIAFEGKALDRSAPYDRARSGIAFVPQGREIFPLLTVKENLETGYRAAEARAIATFPSTSSSCFPVLKQMLARRGGDLSGGQQQQLAIGRALVMRPKLLVLDEPTEGIQPSIIKDIGRAIRYLRDTAGIAILLVEQYLDFCRELADEVNIMDRGQIVHTGPAEDLDRADVKKYLTV